MPLAASSSQERSNTQSSVTENNPNFPPHRLSVFYRDGTFWDTLREIEQGQLEASITTILESLPCRPNSGPPIACY